jgi:hypothetical protein
LVVGGKEGKSLFKTFATANIERVPLKNHPLITHNKIKKKKEKGERLLLIV